MSSRAGDEPIFDALFQLFMQRGFGGFSMADVAELAGVSESEVHALGSSRAELVVQALELQVPMIRVCPDTGSLRGDILEVVQWQIELVRKYAPIIDRSLEEAQHSVEYAAQARKNNDERLVVYRPILERAQARGEIAGDVDESTFYFVFSQVYGRHLDGRPIEPGFAEQVADLLVSGLLGEAESLSDT